MQVFTSISLAFHYVYVTTLLVLFRELKDCGGIKFQHVDLHCHIN